MATRGTGLLRRGNDLNRYDPWSEVQDMRQTMDDVFSRFIGFTPMSRLVGGSLPAGWGWEPNVDLYETEDHLVFRAELAGFTRDDIDLKVSSDTLQITAQHRDDDSTLKPAPEARSKDGNASPREAKPESKPKDSSTTVQTTTPQHPRTYHIQGRQRQSFTMSYTLPVEINPEKVEASFKDGILEVSMPKPEQSKPKQVQVNVRG